MVLMLTDRGEQLHWSSVHLQGDFPNISREINANTNNSVLISYPGANSVASTVWNVRHQEL